VQRPYFLPPWHHKGVEMPSPVSVLGRSQACVVYSLADASLQAMFLPLEYLESEHIIQHEYQAKSNCFWPCCPTTNMNIILETGQHFCFIQLQHFRKWDLSPWPGTQVPAQLGPWTMKKNLNHSIFCVVAHSSVAPLITALILSISLPPYYAHIL